MKNLKRLSLSVLAVGAILAGAAHLSTHNSDASTDWDWSGFSAGSVFGGGDHSQTPVTDSTAPGK